MITINQEQELYALEGSDVGTSDWMLIDQKMIDLFADATDDHQWIHVDAAKAAKSPFGATIAHGFLLLSLLPRLKSEMVKFMFAKMAINYGSDKVRFIAPVPVNSRVRLKTTLVRVEKGTSGIKLFTKNNLEIEGSAKDALVAETITLLVV